MKNIVILSAITALLVLSGCSKDPKVDEATSAATNEVVKDKAAEKVSSVETETVSSKEASVVRDNGSALSSSDSMSSLENDLATIYFDFDKFNIRADMQSRVSTDASIVNKKASKFSIKLEGNCDEWGSDEYNFALGLRRSNTVKKALIAEGVSASRIAMVSFGESNPTCTTKTRDCWAKNRRVDFKLLP